jgi:GT2 family glycosyltransferase
MLCYHTDVTTGGAGGRAPRWSKRCTTRAKVVHVDVDEPLRPVEVEERYPQVLVVVHCGGRVVGQTFVPTPAGRTLSPAQQWKTVSDYFGSLVWRNRLRGVLERRFLGAPSASQAGAQPSVSAIVCTRDRPDQLRRCLEALLALETPPNELLVVDNCPSDDRTERLAGEFPVTYLLEAHPGQSRARNRGIIAATGDLIAFTDDDCVPDRAWLDNLDGSFDDPLVMALTGYIGPFELEHPAQYLFEIHHGFGRWSERRVLDPVSMSPFRAGSIAGAGANMIFRREVFERVGLFPEDLGPGTPARSGDDKYYFFRLLSAGYRIVQEPERKVWHRHRGDFGALKRIMNDYGVAEFALATRCLVADREVPALRMWLWWLSHFRQDLVRLVRRHPARIPLALTLAELRGAFVGPWAMLRSWRIRPNITEVRLLPPEAVDEEQGEPASLSVASELPGLSVTIATYNRREELPQVLGSLARQDYPPDRFEVILVVDGSRDRSAEVARSLELPYRLRVLEQENRGTAVARNRGVREAEAPIVVFLDDDIRPEPQFLAVHARAHHAGDDRIALGYCPPATQADTIWAVTLRNWWEDHYRLKAQPEYQWTFVDCSEGNASLKRELFLSLGGYDESFPKNRADWDLGVRLLEAGVRFSFHWDAKAWHHYSTRLQATLLKTREAGRMDVLLASKHPRVVGQLPLANIAWLLATRPRVASRGYRAVSRLLVESPIGHPLLQSLESVRLRRLHRKRVESLLARAYLLGVRDALPEPDALRELLAPIAKRSDVTTVPLWLDRDEQVVVPGAVGRVDLEVGWNGRSWGTVEALRNGGQWDWDLIIRRIVDELGEAARLDLTFAGLLQADCPLQLAGDDEKAVSARGI